MEIKFIGSAPTNFRAGRPLAFRPEAIVIHIAVGSLGSVDAQFNNPASQVSAHYCVGKKGEIHQYVHETDTAFHAGNVVNPSWDLLKPNVNPNFYTIGIEHEGMPQDEWPAPQIATSAALVGDIARRWNIALDPLHVIRHHQIRASKSCPGDFITIEKILGNVPPAAAGRSPATVQTRTAVNLRMGSPSTSAPILRKIAAQTVISVSGVEEGEPVAGNKFWYSDGSGNFIWAGATDRPQPGP
jgi:N-acetylmuramoyl-L-alanine amidase CwlA